MLLCQLSKKSKVCKSHRDSKQIIRWWCSTLKTLSLPFHMINQISILLPYPQEGTYQRFNLRSLPFSNDSSYKLKQLKLSRPASLTIWATSQAREVSTQTIITSPTLKFISQAIVQVLPLMSTPLPNSAHWWIPLRRAVGSERLIRKRGSGGL